MPTDESLRSLLPYGTEAHPFEYFLTEIGENKIQSCVEWHWHREMEYTWVLSGSAVCCLEAEQVALDTGTGMFVNSGTLHQYIAREPCVMACFVFSPEFIAPESSEIFEQYVQPVLDASCLYLTFQTEQERERSALSLLERLYECSESEGTLQTLRVRNLTAALWEEVFVRIRAYPGSEKTKKERLVQARLHKMTEHIARHYGESIKLEEIAAAANVSSREALRCFRVGMQTTPVHYLNEYRLRRARERLVATTDAVSHISEAVGFESVGYFCRVFKKQYGVSPSAFRKREAALG